jgi:hypothetical protein
VLERQLLVSCGQRHRQLVRVRLHSGRRVGRLLGLVRQRHSDSKLPVLQRQDQHVCSGQQLQHSERAPREPSLLSGLVLRGRDLLQRRHLQQRCVRVSCLVHGRQLSVRVGSRQRVGWMQLDVWRRLDHLQHCVRILAAVVLALLVLRLLVFVFVFLVRVLMCVVCWCSCNDTFANAITSNSNCNGLSQPSPYVACTVRGAAASRAMCAVESGGARADTVCVVLCVWCCRVLTCAATAGSVRARRARAPATPRVPIVSMRTPSRARLVRAMLAAAMAARLARGAAVTLRTAPRWLPPRSTVAL